MEFGKIMQNNGDYAVQDISRITILVTILVPMESDFLCVNNSNLPRILHRFRDTVDYLSNFCCQQGMPVFYPLVRGKPLHSSQNLLEATKKLETPLYLMRSQHRWGYKPG